MHLTSSATDLAIIGQMKSHLMTQLLRYFTMTDIHVLRQHFSIQGWETSLMLWHLILRQEVSQPFELRRMIECVQNEQDENDDQDDSKEPTQKRWTVDEKGAQCTRREITVRLDDWTQGWDGVGCISQHGVGGDNDCGNRVGLEKFFFNSAGLRWGWLGMNWVGMGSLGKPRAGLCFALSLSLFIICCWNSLPHDTGVIWHRYSA